MAGNIFIVSGPELGTHIVRHCIVSLNVMLLWANYYGLCRAEPGTTLDVFKVLAECVHIHKCSRCLGTVSYFRRFLPILHTRCGSNYIVTNFEHTTLTHECQVFTNLWNMIKSSIALMCRTFDDVIRFWSNVIGQWVPPLQQLPKGSGEEISQRDPQTLEAADIYNIQKTTQNNVRVYV